MATELVYELDEANNWLEEVFLELKRRGLKQWK